MKDYFDDEEFDGLFDDENSGENSNLSDINSADFEALIEKLRRVRQNQLIKENYENIVKNGIDIEGIAEYGPENLNRLKKTLEIMIDHYEEKEEYEKCHDIKKFFDEVNKVVFT